MTNKRSRKQPELHEQKKHKEVSLAYTDNTENLVGLQKKDPNNFCINISTPPNEQMIQAKTLNQD